MKKIALSLAVLAGVLAESRGEMLRGRVEAKFGDAPLVFDAGSYETSAGQRVSVSRLDFLVSEFSVRVKGGGWVGPSDWAAYVSAGAKRSSFEVEEIPRGNYDRIAFLVGLPPEVNGSDPAKYGPEHPLNPNVNGLHWGWQGGYVFMALEGGWWEKEERQGYSYHLAGNGQLVRVELPVELKVGSDVEVEFELDVAKVFGGVTKIRLSEERASTHSREGDELADQLRKNMEGAFRIAKVKELSTRDGKAQEPVVVLVASNATPYRMTYPPYFSPPKLPADNPLTVEGVKLGALLFFDPRLSRNNAQSCGSCHRADAAFSDAGRAVSVGADGKHGERNSMPLFNLAWKSAFFWDGRAATLREQVLQPIENPIEMNKPVKEAVASIANARVSGRHRERAEGCLTMLTDVKAVERLSRSGSGAESYRDLFSGAFGSPEITADRLARALEQFLLAQISADSKFDRFVRREGELTGEERRGFELFNTEYDPGRGKFGADCFHCHGGPIFQSQSFANNGLDAEFKDSGRHLVTKRKGDEGKFAVPSLRNVALTGPYMHDGRFETLEEVIEHYAEGVKKSETLDPNLAKHPKGGVPLNESDRKALVAFLKTLTDE